MYLVWCALFGPVDEAKQEGSWFLLVSDDVGCWFLALYGFMLAALAAVSSGRRPRTKSLGRVFFAAKFRAKFFYCTVIMYGALRTVDLSVFLRHLFFKNRYTTNRARTIQYDRKRS